MGAEPLPSDWDLERQDKDKRQTVSAAPDIAPCIRREKRAPIPPLWVERMGMEKQESRRARRGLARLIPQKANRSWLRSGADLRVHSGECYRVQTQPAPTRCQKTSGT